MEENLLAGGDEEMEVSENEDDIIRKKPRKDDPLAAIRVSRSLIK